ncbi:protein unc-80 homolog [Eurytemora carolleeae]|uniref:protein unc-80 homolog n=1 Tax=Eurytemora carolleeae TaxID=1294199 RepID=UPI000C75F7D9|nr:protein unc-80 homolog [Eurytemora carolleeae]|eukprot:XP_023345788.1 protein unc-80 homolog [Eurytemora affinis]
MSSLFFSTFLAPVILPSIGEIPNNSGQGAQGAQPASKAKPTLAMSRWKKITGTALFINRLALQRQDSITSKRKISSVSSEVSEQEPQEETPSVPVPAAAVAAPTIPAAAAAPIASATPTLEAEKDQVESPTLHIEDASEEDIQLEVHLPWLKTVIEITKNINLSCTHQGFCQQNCVRRLSRSCKKLMEAMKYLYGEELEFIEDIFMESNSTENEMKKGKWTRWSESASTSPDQRKESSYRRETSKDTIDSEPTEKRDRIADSANQLPLDIQPNPGFLKYLQLKVCGLMHAPLSTLNKASCVMDEESLKSITLTAWSLLMDPDVDVSGAATAIIIVASVKSPDNIQTLFSGDLNNPIADTRINGILKVQTLWQNRYQIWSRLEENGHINMKILPSQIEFTLPSPKIGIETLPLVEPAWMPKTKTKFENIDMRRRGQTIISATKSRKKQQTELVRSVLYAEADKKRKERESLQITAVPVALCAAQEPSLFLSPPDAESDQDSDTEREGAPVRPVQSQSTVAQPLLPSTVCAAFAEIIMMLDDHGVSTDGIAVYEVAYQIIWSFLVEDCNLFLKYFMEKLTRNGQEETFQIIRSLIRFIPKLPQQAAFSLYNYLIGYIMFFVRTPRENGEDMIGSALSLLWMVVHSVQGQLSSKHLSVDASLLMQVDASILIQVDASILITANVPSAKKIVVHGPQGFTVQEVKLLKRWKIHNPWHFVRDFYFFKRSQYPQLSLVYRTPQDAYLELQKQAFKLKFVEIGKVMLIWGILKNVSQVVQRVVFLHEDLVKLPTFPRKALEAELDLFEKGDIGKELQSIDVLHKFNWIRLISRMFEAMAGNFARPEDIQLFINVINGSLALHPEEACILRNI